MMMRRAFLRQTALAAMAATSGPVGALGGKEKQPGLATDAEAALHRDELAP